MDLQKQAQIKSGKNRFYLIWQYTSIGKVYKCLSECMWQKDEKNHQWSDI